MFLNLFSNLKTDMTSLSGVSEEDVYQKLYLYVSKKWFGSIDPVISFMPHIKLLTTDFSGHNTLNIKMIFTHCGWKDDNSKYVHSITCSWPRANEDIWGRRQVKGKVLDVCPVIILDTVDERSPCGGLWLALTHSRLGLHNGLATSSILSPGKRSVIGLSY